MAFPPGRHLAVQPVIVQIYEITSAAEAAALSALGVDHIGVLAGHGEFLREQPVARAAEIFASVSGGAKRCALSLSGDVSVIAGMVTALPADILHLGAAPDRLDIKKVRLLKRMFPALPVMRSIPVIDDNSIELARAYDGIADMLLLDSCDPADRQIGALGVTHNWDLDRRIVESVRIPVIIAGGLGPENVADAIRISRPAGVDSKTRTDKSDGSHTKDLAKVRAFTDAARQCAAGL
jgi:phosphoribosylanthranilate isomerase